MGLRGPAPTPTAILKARGSWRADERAGEVQFEAGLGTCPSWLPKEAKAEWRRQAKQLTEAGLAQQTDRALLVAWCVAWAEFVGLTARIDAANRADDGVDYEASWARGHLTARGKAIDRMLRLAAQFGFSPSARVRLRGQEQQPEGTASDGKARFFAG